MKAMLHNTYNWQKDEKQQISGKNNYRLMDLPAATSSLKSDWEDEKRLQDRTLSSSQI
jgi:hypothetical protein